MPLATIGSDCVEPLPTKREPRAGLTCQSFDTCPCEVMFCCRVGSASSNNASIQSLASRSFERNLGNSSAFSRDEAFFAQLLHRATLDIDSNLKVTR